MKETYSLLRASLTPEQVKRFKAIKTLPDNIKAIILGGCLDQGAYIQFHSDIKIYNLLEALTYVSGYEPKHYVEGTALKALRYLINELHQ